MRVAGVVLPGEMTPRARAYLMVEAVRHVLVGLACVLFTDGFRSDTYRGIKDLLPLPADTAILGWGVVFIATGIFLCVAAVLGREGEARWALLASVMTTALWAAGLTTYVVAMWFDTGELINMTGPVVWSALVFLDITMLRSPLRNPFEELIRKTAAQAGVDPDGP